MKRQSWRELLRLLLPFVVLKLAATAYVHVGGGARKETVSYAIPGWWRRRRRGGGDAASLTGVGKAVAVSVGFVSESYMAAVFLTTCVLFRLTCALVLLKLNAFLVMMRGTDDDDDDEAAAPAATDDDVDDDDDDADSLRSTGAPRRERDETSRATTTTTTAAATATTTTRSNHRAVMSEHLNLRFVLNALGKRFRLFLVLTLLLTLIETVVSLYELVLDFAVAAKRSSGGGGVSGVIAVLARADLLLNNALHLAGIGMNVRAATLITHRLQRVVGHFSQQHAAYTMLDSDDDDDDGGDDEGGGGGDDDVENSRRRRRRSSARRRVDAFIERDAVLGHFRDRPLGISIYGFFVDRYTIRTLDGVVFGSVIFIVSRALMDAARADGE